ncbi:Multistep phosphorelay regulator 1 [Ceratocystis platani]|uniref:Multistep phosphorelay regulator 1 n=1 Tax=Ceratocystis fimbriata f. sp. platani TaxID=88771 RepID=A0A0F8B430_CERFI|nr:Multistep phosphorelay regulator 1 [Ceratocystis platani]
MSSPIEEPVIVDLGDGFDAMIFSQILEMDESTHDRSFSRELVVDYLSQARDTFTNIRIALKKHDLTELSNLGHYLKGSSAALGLANVQVHCQKIQQFGKLQDMEENTLEPPQALEMISKTLEALITDFEAAEAKLRDFYDGFEGLSLPAISQGGASSPQQGAEEKDDDEDEYETDDEDDEDADEDEDESDEEEEEEDVNEKEAHEKGDKAESKP